MFSYIIEYSIFRKAPIDLLCFNKGYFSQRIETAIRYLY